MRCRTCKIDVEPNKPMVYFESAGEFFCMDCFFKAFVKVYGEDERINKMEERIYSLEFNLNLVENNTNFELVNLQKPLKTIEDLENRIDHLEQTVGRISLRQGVETEYTQKEY